LIAFNAAPGTVAQNEAGPYSSYAQALAEMMREGGLPVTDCSTGFVFASMTQPRVRRCRGTHRSWKRHFIFLSGRRMRRRRKFRPNRLHRSDRSPSVILTRGIAYLAALDRDNLQDYENFLRAYPNDPMARRVRAIVAARREAITWRRSRSVDTPPAYCRICVVIPAAPTLTMRGVGLHI